MKLRLIPLLILVLCAGCGSAGGGGADDPSKPIVVAHVPSPLFTPLYVAESKGYFKDEGIEVKLQPVASGQDAVPLASSGQVDVITAGFSAGFFSALDSGLKLKVVGSMAVGDGGTDNPPSALEVDSKLVNSGKVRGARDLKGLKVAVAGGPGGSGAYLLDLIMRDAGLSVKDVALSNISNADMPAALSSGSVSAIMTSAPFTDVVEKDGTGTPIAVPPAGSSGTGVIYSERFAASDRAQKFFNALARAAADLQGNDRRLPENVDPVANIMNVEPSVITNLPLFAWREDLAPLPDQLEAMQQTWIDAGQLKYDKPIATADFVDLKFSQQAVAPK